MLFILLDRLLYRCLLQLFGLRCGSGCSWFSTWAPSIWCGMFVWLVWRGSIRSVSMLLIALLCDCDLLCCCCVALVFTRCNAWAYVTVPFDLSFRAARDSRYFWHLVESASCSPLQFKHTGKELSRMQVYRRDATQPISTQLNATQLDMYWLTTQLNSTQLNWTDSCGMKHRKTITRRSYYMIMTTSVLLLFIGRR